MLLNDLQTGFWNRHSLSARMRLSHIQKEVFSTVGCAAWECFQCVPKDVVALSNWCVTRSKHVAGMRKCPSDPILSPC